VAASAVLAVATPVAAALPEGGNRWPTFEKMIFAGKIDDASTILAFFYYQSWQGGKLK